MWTWEHDGVGSLTVEAFESLCYSAWGLRRIDGACAHLAESEWAAARWSQRRSASDDGPRHITLSDPRLVLGWIEADFRVQIRIFQHFSKCTRKSSSREQILLISAKNKKRNSAKILTLFFLQTLQIFAKFSEIRKFLQNFFCRILQKFLDFENAEKCYIGCQKIWKFC